MQKDDDWEALKKQLDVHLGRLYVAKDVLAEPEVLAQELVVISSYKVNLSMVSVELNTLADKRKASVYYDILAKANGTRAREECRLDQEYLELKRVADTVAAYLKHVSDLITTVQTYLRWKSQEANL